MSKRVPRKRSAKKAAGAARSARSASITAAELHAALDEIAPFHLAADWDNVGQIAGSCDWPADRVLVALDLTDAVAREAIDSGANALVLYHPPIFKGIRRITAQAESPTTLLPDVLAARVNLFAVHTAYDASVHGTNDVLLDAFDTGRRWPLEPLGAGGRSYRLVTFVPRTEVDGLRTALSAAGAGQIGHYSECSFEIDGRGTFRGDETTKPAVGDKLRLEKVEETRLEMVVPKNALGRVIGALYANHSYEEPAFDVYPLYSVEGRADVGMGRIAELRKPASGVELLQQLERVANLQQAAVAGDLQKRFARVLAAAGSFGVEKFRDADALVLTGEFKHHDALTLLRRGVTAVALGHAESERPALRRLAERLTKRLAGGSVRLARSDKSPFFPLHSMQRARWAET